MKQHVLQAILDTPWAIMPSKLEALTLAAARWAGGVQLTAEEISAVTGARPGRSGGVSGSVAIIPVFGTIVPRASLMSATSGLTSAEQISAGLRVALNDSSVSAIVLDVDSPGGAVQGIDELSAEVYAARGRKPIVAVANHLAASAAYWIASAAGEFSATPSAEVGSIGIIAAHDDLSGALEKAGVKTTLLSAGKYKTEGNSYEPLGDEARNAIQRRVDEYYAMFTRSVARNRGVNVEEVRQGYGEGRIVGAREALRLGMIDRIETLDEAVARLQRGADIAEIDRRQRRARAIAGRMTV